MISVNFLNFIDKFKLLSPDQSNAVNFSEISGLSRSNIDRMLRSSQLLRVIFLISDDNSDAGSESNSDLEELSQRNRSLRPYRDQKPDGHSQTSEEKHDLDRDPHQKTGAKIMEPEMIRKKVKQSLAKKQQKARRTKRGEAGVVTRKRRENRSAIQQSRDGIW